MFSIAKKLGISAHEVGRVKFMWWLRFLFQVGFVFAWTIVTAIFIDIFTIENILWLILGDAVLFLLGSFLANYLFLKTNHNVFLSSTVLGTIVLVSIATIFRHNAFLFFGAALLAKDFFFSQLGIAILRKNESLFSPQEAQRIMPILESALTFGTIFSAIMFLWLLDYYPTETLLAFWLVPLSCMFVMIVRAPSILQEMPSLHKEKVSVSNNIFENFRAAERVPFLKLMTLVVFFQAALFSMVEFEFIKSVKEHSNPHEKVEIHTEYLQTNLLKDAIPKIKEVGHKIAETVEQTKSNLFVHDTVAHDLGFLSLVFGLVSLIVQLFLSRWCFKKIGVVNTMGVYFAGFLGMIAWFFTGGISMSFVRGFQHGFHSLFEAPYHLSFYAIFSEKRESIRHLFEGFVKPVGIIFGVMMLLILQFFDHYVGGGLMAVFAIIILMLVVVMRSKFTNLSTKNLTSNQNVSAKLHAVEVLAQKGHSANTTLILAEELLKQETHPIVQEKIIKTLSLINEPEAVHVYLTILSDTQANEELKIQILESLLKLEKLRDYWGLHAFSQHHLLRMLQNIFEETNHKHMRKLVVMNIFAHLPAHKVAPYFIEILENSDSELQAICLRSASEVFDDPEMGYYVREYLEKGNSKLKGYAIIALWKFEDQQKLMTIIDELLQGDQAAQIAAIYAIGETGCTKWNEELYRYVGAEDVQLRLHALVALTKMGNEDVVPEILAILFGKDEALAQKLFFMLKRVGTDQRDLIKNEIQHEVSRRVLEILLAESVTHKDHLQNLSKDVKRYLTHLYRLGEKYDDLVMMEGV